MHELSKGAQKVTFYSRSGSDILSKWFGESEANLRDLFEAVRQESAHEQARTTYASTEAQFCKAIAIITL